MPLRVIEDGQYAIDSTGFSTVFYDRDVYASAPCG